MIKRLFNYFTTTEKLIWICSCTAITVFFIIFDRNSFLSLFASLLGATSLIFCAKGNPAGLVIMIVFSVLYGIISYSFCYYGEMITYVFMTLPMSAYSLICWLRNPYGNNKSEVRVSNIGKTDFIILPLTAILITTAFYFILEYFNTANLMLSTLSVTTSYAAVYLTARRSPLYALAYAANDIVLIGLWALASTEDISYISVTVCFAAFLINDIYGYISWNRMKRKQAQ
ncbi:MAG: nicotinamide mononucleotide transporter [Ruminiclostridium sp.]|nr:nicotinamide mononucleotide transporter [Ruminiclostridium sp.]